MLLKIIRGKFLLVVKLLLGRASPRTSMGAAITIQRGSTGRGGGGGAAGREAKVGMRTSTSPGVGPGPESECRYVGLPAGQIQFQSKHWSDREGGADVEGGRGLVRPLRAACIPTTTPHPRAHQTDARSVWLAGTLAAQADRRPEPADRNPRTGSVAPRRTAPHTWGPYTPYMPLCSSLG